MADPKPADPTPAGPDRYSRPPHDVAGTCPGRPPRANPGLVRCLAMTAALALLTQPADAVTQQSQPGPQLGPKLSTENINLSADVLNSDTRNDVHVLTGNVRITQGQMSMQAQQATATAMQTDHSRWTFEHDVRIHTAEAELRSDSANAAFVDGRIATAVARGTPAYFEQRSADVAKNVRGRANLIEYDFAKGSVRLSQNVWLSYGGNEFRGDVVVYDVKDEKVVVNPDGQSSGNRVNITIRPGSTPPTGGASRSPSQPDAAAQPADPPAPQPESSPPESNP